MRVICFHNPVGDRGCLRCRYRKAELFKDYEADRAIMSSDNPAEIKRFGRQAALYDDHLRRGIGQSAVFEGLMAVFSQNPELRDFLTDTGLPRLPNALSGIAFPASGCPRKPPEEVILSGDRYGIFRAVH